MTRKFETTDVAHVTFPGNVLVQRIGIWHPQLWAGTQMGGRAQSVPENMPTRVPEAVGLQGCEMHLACVGRGVCSPTVRSKSTSYHKLGGLGRMPGMTVCRVEVTAPTSQTVPSGPQGLCTYFSLCLPSHLCTCLPSSPLRAYFKHHLPDDSYWKYPPPVIFDRE